MRILNDFECPNGHYHEYFVDSSETSVRCKECELEATKVLKAPMFREKTTGRHVTGKALERWTKKRERHLKQERKSSSSEE